MTSEEFNKVIKAQFNRCEDVLCAKADEYADNIDRLHNFKCAAGMMNCGPKEALAGMMAKYTISVYDMCRDGEDHPIELWVEKITDHINYLLLLRAIVAEETAEDKVNQKNKKDCDTCANLSSKSWTEPCYSCIEKGDFHNYSPMYFNPMEDLD